MNNYFSTIFTCILLFLLASRAGTGFMLFLATPFIVIYMIYSIFIIFRAREKRKPQIIKGIILTSCLLLIFGLHEYYGYASRLDANEVATNISEYSRQHSRYPATLTELGLNKDDLKSRFDLMYNLMNDGQPFLVYSDTWNAFNKYFYDFKKKEWQFIPD